MRLKFRRERALSPPPTSSGLRALPPFGEDSGSVTYVIAEPCIDVKDKTCIDVCPVDCIHEAEQMLVIDPEECIDCGACEPECPVEAIFPEDAIPEKWQPFVAINYAFPNGLDAVNALVATQTAIANEATDAEAAA